MPSTDAQSIPAPQAGAAPGLRTTPTPVVVLISGSGTLLQALIDASRDPAYAVTIAAVGSDRPGVAGLERAERAGIPTFVSRVRDFETREAWDAALTEQVSAYAPALVVSAGFLKLVGTRFLQAFGGRYLNSHNALLPSFAGIHGPRDALTYGVKIAGATLFVVDDGIDTGAIVAQCAVPVEDDDTVDSLTERIKAAERPQLVDYVGRMAREGFTISGRRVRIGDR
ncbi:phosphoribosylglycinamide formyltransferase [Leekyejoonella antrihumi]|uniref:phosphoribosylglycinamide formyltransferase n=1 Tax=Leekyejoonella antrihumi TaxID=1660198 RepID=UPI00319E0261